MHWATERRAPKSHARVALAGSGYDVGGGRDAHAVELLEDVARVDAGGLGPRARLERLHEKTRRVAVRRRMDAEKGKDALPLALANRGVRDRPRPHVEPDAAKCAA